MPRFDPSPCWGGTWGSGAWVLDARYRARPRYYAVPQKYEFGKVKAYAMEQMPGTNTVFLKIESRALSADELFAALRLRPGEANVSSHPPYCSLLISTGEAGDSELWQQMYATVDRAKVLLELARPLSSQIHMNINCHVTSPGEWRGVTIPPDLLHALSGLGLWVGFVFQQVPQPGETNSGERVA